ncbi:MAG: hypothetical protein U0Q18_36750 [Bryobacteraceae bacterium]
MSCAVAAATSDFVLGVDYSERIPNLTSAASPFYAGPAAVHTDANGFIYLLINAYSIVKLTPSGNQIVYSIHLVFPALAMTVDPEGNVYIAGRNFVQKRGGDGNQVVYSTTIAADASITGFTVDAKGRAYVCGVVGSADLPVTPGAMQSNPNSSLGQMPFAARLNANGGLDYATYLGGTSFNQVIAIASGSDGSAFVTGWADPNGFPTTPGAYLSSAEIPQSVQSPFLLRLSTNGSSLVYSTFLDSQGSAPCCLAVAGDAAVVALASGSNARFLRMNASGTATEFSTTVPLASPTGLVVDDAGRTYAALRARSNTPVKNSLATCGEAGTAGLAVMDSRGTVSQVTFLAGSSPSALAAGTGLGSSLYVLGVADSSFQGTRDIAGSSPSGWFLYRFSPNPNASLVSLACVANSANHDSAGITGGEIVSLYGEGLGPATGAQPQIDAQSGVPKELAGVQVTFNGTPGPLLYVQDGQVNAIAPWALQGPNVDVCVSYNGTATNCIKRPVLAAHPGVFMADDTYAVAFNLDGTLNSASNPAAPGSWVYFFATGLGPASPLPADGSIIGLPLPKDTLPTQVLWDQQAWIVTTPQQAVSNYAGPAPFRVAGVSQINMIVEDTYGCNQIVCFASPFYLSVPPGPSTRQYFMVHISSQH